MTALSTKQRAKVNAALAILHGQGHDVAALQRQVQAHTAKGHSALQAYEAVIGGFLKANPDSAPAITRITALIGASDSNTVAQYDTALSTYIRTGDVSVIDALEPMIRADSAALAVKNGELSADDAAAGRVDWGAMGFTDPAPAAAAQTFAFGGPATAAPNTALADKQAGDGRHWASTGGGTGVRSAKAEARFGAFPVPGAISQSPYAGLAPAQIKEAMRADAAAPRGWVDRPTEA
jgi:hypothetical protein